ncbi:MAG: ThiF family adenylyltransferase [Prevotellaceae bacterium]|jgi:molybdopterin/thiamine biosynthesis adenylyltransferase|nr:ThiF family adenylyltransferase [Prevotellaceae bacterium]
MKKKKQNSSVLSSKEQRLYDRQIKGHAAGLEKQELIRQTKVAIVGLCGVGVTTARLLHNTGFGNLVMISNSLVNEDSLPSMTYLGWRDIGKHRCIAMHDRLASIHTDVSEKFEIYCTLPSPENVDKLFEGCQAVVDTCRGVESTVSILDYADAKDIPVMIAYGQGWKGFIATYAGANREILRNRIMQAYQNDEMCMCRRFCFGFLNSAIGSITVGHLTQLMWNMRNRESRLTEYDFQFGKVSSLLGE